MDAGSSPAARTVTLTGSGTNGKGLVLSVLVFTGAEPLVRQYLAATTSTANPAQVTYTPRATNSYAVMAVGRNVSATSYTVNANSTSLGALSDATNGEGYATARSTSQLTAGLGVSLGWSNGGTSEQFILWEVVESGAVYELLSPDTAGYEAGTGQWVDQSTQTTTGTNGTLTRVTSGQRSGSGAGKWLMNATNLVVVSKVPLVALTGGRLYTIGGYVNPDAGNSGFLGLSSTLNWSSTTASVTVVSTVNLQTFTNPTAGTWTQYGGGNFRAPITAAGVEWVWNPQGVAGNIVYNDDNTIKALLNTFYLSTAAADAAVTVGSGTKKEATPDLPGGTATLANVNTAAGNTTGLQYTDSTTAGTNGTAMSWYSPPLSAQTISGTVQWQHFGRESANTSNAAPTIQIERCSGDGTVLSTVLSKNTNQNAGEYATTAGGATRNGSATPTSTTLADGDRLRFTVWIDDAVDQGGSGTMASGGNCQFWYGANTGQGLAQVTFAEVFTIYSPATGGTDANVSASLFAGGTAQLQQLGVTAQAQLASGTTGTLSSLGVGVAAATRAGLVSSAQSQTSATVSGVLEGAATARLPSVGVGTTALLEAGAAPSASVSLTRVDGAYLAAAVFAAAPTSLAVNAYLAVGAAGRAGALDVQVALESLLVGVSARASSTSDLAVAALTAAGASPRAVVSGSVSVAALLAGGTVPSSTGGRDTTVVVPAYVAASPRSGAQFQLVISAPLPVGTTSQASVTGDRTAVGALLGSPVPYANATLEVSRSAVAFSSLLVTALVGSVDIVVVTGALYAAGRAAATVTRDSPLAATVTAGSAAWGATNVERTVTAMISSAVAPRAPSSADRTVAGQLVTGEATLALTTAALSASALLSVGGHTRAAVTSDLQVQSLLSAGLSASGPVTITATASGLLAVGELASAQATANLFVPTTGLLVVGTWGALLIAVGHGDPRVARVTAFSSPTRTTHGTTSGRTTGVATSRR